MNDEVGTMNLGRGEQTLVLKDFSALYSPLSILQNLNKYSIMKLEHIGIAVKDLENSNQLFRQLFGKKHYKIEEVTSEYVKTSFFKTGASKIELLEATSENSAIAKFIEKRGEGIHHIAFEVKDIYAEMKRLEDEGFRLLNKEPKRGADNKLVCFVHPKTANGVLVELCQTIREKDS